MTEDCLISIIIWAKSTNEHFFMDSMKSLGAQDYENFEVLLLDDTRSGYVERVARETFSDTGRLSYHRLKKSKGLSYAMNVGLQRRKGSYVFFLGQHDRLSPDALSSFAKAIKDNPEADLIYSDRDELIGMYRRNPAFLPDFNIELLRHTNYIGDNVCFSIRGIKKTGILRESLESAAVYDLLLRGIEKKLKAYHIPRLLYHTRILGDMLPSPQMKKALDAVYREHMTVAGAHLRKMGIKANVIPDRSGEFWRIEYDGSDAYYNDDKYLLVKEKGISVRQRDYLDRMYGILKQKDVGAVGVKFEKGAFTIDNCGYIFDNRGIAYPACHNQSALKKGYMNRAVLPCDVSMVDAGLVLFDRKVLAKTGGFDRSLTGRAMMLDMCMKIRKLGRRVVFTSTVTAYKHRRGSDNTSSEESNARLIERWGDKIKAGDPYYNRNLPMGLMNYVLY